MTEPSPGPWAYSINAIYDNIVRDSNNFVVCQVGSGFNNEDIANAELIAAAPELLEALTLAKGAVEWMAGATDSDPEDHELLEVVNKAIAKARGESDETQN